MKLSLTNIQNCHLSDLLHCINSVVLYVVHKLGRQHSLFITGHADPNGLDIKCVPWSRPNNRAWEDYSFQTAN